MSDLHKDDERPQQYRVRCMECGTEPADRLRMHSRLAKRHLSKAELDPEPGVTYVQCNVCDNIRAV